jgi:acetylornithine deacetylase/succinyl-diaminopimelate desuccinylase-like protein
MASRATLICAAAAIAGTLTLDGVAADASAAKALSRDILKQLVEINTTDSVGSVTAASEAMAMRLLDAGFAPSDVAVLGPNDRKKNLVTRLRGSGKQRPILLIGHLDVVEARREDWSTDPFALVEKDGFFYGRGTLDMKDGDAIMVATLIRLKRENFHPDRDIILALTADEESGSANGVEWLLRTHRELIDAQYVINQDGYSVLSRGGTPQFFELDATEKVYADYQLTVTNPGGHSSLPVPDNAIYTLTDALSRLAHYEFPVELNTVTRGYYQRMAGIETGPRAADMRAILAGAPDPAAVQRLSRDPLDHANLHTTCVATRLEAGHANNALPQRAQAVVNCRILPGHSPEEVRQALIGVFADPKITVRYIADDGQVLDLASDRKGYAPPPLPPEIMAPLEKLVSVSWPGIRVVPTMSTGASDGVYTSAAGLPTYVIAGIAIDRDDVRAHGRDERVAVDSFYRGGEFFYRYLKALTAH